MMPFTMLIILQIWPLVGSAYHLAKRSLADIYTKALYFVNTDFRTGTGKYFDADARIPWSSNTAAGMSTSAGVEGSRVNPWFVDYCRGVLQGGLKRRS